MYVHEENNRPRSGKHADRLVVNLDGPVDLVARALRAVADVMPTPTEDTQQPVMGYWTRQQAIERSGLSDKRLKRLMDAGAVRNYGTTGKILIDPEELRAAIAAGKARG